MRKNILHIIYQTNVIWWVEMFLQSILNSSKNNDILVQVYNKKNKTWIKNKIINLNEKIHSYNPIILIYQVISRAFKYKKICKLNDINISISHWDSLNLSNIISKILFRNKSKTYILLHNSLWFHSNKSSFIYKYFFKYLYPKSDKIITVSKELELNLKNKWYKNVETIYNYLDFKKIEKLKGEKLWKYENLFNLQKKTFITVSRLEEVKNIKFLIEAFDEFNKKNKAYQFLIIWDWKQKQKLQELIENIKNKNIKLLWEQKNIYKFLNKSHYFLFSSFSEWFWRTLIESLSCGIPVLTHDFKYWAREIIRNSYIFNECLKTEIHENWILSPYLNKKEFLKSMKKITQINFSKTKIKNNIKKYDIKNLEKDWEYILNNS